MDRYTKVVLSVIAISLMSIAVKDVELFPVAEAQQGSELDNELALDGFMQALPAANAYTYVCTTTYVPRSTNSGLLGYVSTSFYSEPQCKGTFDASGVLYGEGATHANSHSYYLMSDTELHYYANSLDRAADTGQRVRYFRCSEFKTQCIKYIQFRGDPADAD